MQKHSQLTIAPREGTVAPIDDSVFARFGVSASAEAVWRTLIARPTLSRVELQRELGVGSEALAADLDALLDAQLVRSGSAPCGVVALDPSLALDAQMSRIEREMAAQAAAFAALRAQMPSLVDTYERGRADAGIQPGFEIIVDVDDIRRHIDLAADRARTDIRSLNFDSEPPEGGRAASPAQLGALARGVRDRLIMATSALEDPTVVVEYERLQELGHLARTLPDVTTRLVVVDRDLAVVPVDASNLELGAIFVRVRSIVDVLCLMFDHMWSVATPVFGGPANADAPVGRTARILELLVMGTKDDRIARSLSISVRTVRREIADLKDRLGVSSRTEIVAGAIRSGWL